MAYFLRQIGVTSGGVDGGGEDAEEAARISKRLSNLMIRCAENMCKADILRIPQKIEERKGSEPDTEEISASSIDVLNSKFVVGPPSTFACVAIAKSILARYESSDNQSSPESDDYGPGCSKGGVENDAKPSRNTDQLVSASLICVFDVLEELSNRDADLCLQALESLLNLIQTMPIECLRSENKISVSSMISVLKKLRESGSASVSSCASSCLAALAVACGEPEHLACAIQSLVCLNKRSDASTGELIQVPENLRRLLLRIREKVHTQNDGIGATWSLSNIENHAICCSFDLPLLPETSPNDTPDDDHRLFSSIASDGMFVYVLNYVGLYKLGSGLQETIMGKLYAANQSLKATKNCMLYMCNGSLYLRRGHSSCICVIDSDCLMDIGEVILPPSSVQNAIYTDGTSFYNASLIANSTFSTAQLNDSFSPTNESVGKKNYRITDVTFLSYGDTRAPHQLTKFLPVNLHSQAVELHLTRDVAFLQARSGKVFYAGNGTRFGLHETGNNWMELVLPEPIVQVSVGLDNIIFRSGAGHAWIASVDDKNRNGRLKKLISSNRRKTVSVCASGRMFGYVTENGKVFMGGYHNMRVNVSNQMLSGFENVHISTFALGKTHGVAVSRSGHLYTWGLNNLNQCGRSETSSHQNANKDQRNFEARCENGDHVWVVDMPTVCAQCGLCSARGSTCGRIRRPKGAMCHCGSGESSCIRCGVCRSCGEEDSTHHIAFSSTHAQQRSSLDPARVVLSKGAHDVKVSSVSCGNFHTVLLASDRRVFTFGSNCHGQLGVGDTGGKIHPQQVRIPADVVIVQVAAGANHTVLRSADGSVYTFGAYTKGQLARETEDHAGWNTVPGRVPGYGPGFAAFAGWIGAEGDSTIIHAHTSLLSAEDVLNAQILASRQNIFIFPREIGKDYIVIRRKHNIFEHHSFEASQLYTSWAMEPSYDMLWAYNAAEMRIRSYSVFKSINCESSDQLESLSYLRAPEFAIPQEPFFATSAMNLGMHLLSATFSATIMHNSDFWKEKSADQSGAENPGAEGYSVVNRFESTGGGWGYSAHSIEAIQFKVSKEIRLVGVGLYGGRGEYISKLKLYRLMGGDSDELYVEQITETDETMYECGAHETATLLFSQPIIIQPNQWHVVSAKISGPSSDCGANGKATIEGDGVVFAFRNSVVSNNGTDVNVGQIPELYYQLGNDCDPKQPNADHDVNKQLTMSMSRLFSPSCLENISAKGLNDLLEVLEWSIRNIRADGIIESVEKIWSLERAGFIALLTMRLLGRFIRTIYKEFEQDDEPNIEIANKVVQLHSMLLEFFSNDAPICDEEEQISLNQCLAEAVRLFTSLSHCFLGSRILINAHLIAVMSRRNFGDAQILTSAVIGSIAKMERIGYRLLTDYKEDRYPLLSLLLTKHFNCEKRQLEALISFTNVLRFLFDWVFSNGVDGTAKLAENIIVKISKELTVIDEDGSFGPTIHQTSARFRKRGAQPAWEMSDGCWDAIAFRVDAEGIRLHGFGVYLPVETDRKHYTAECMTLTPDASEKWTTIVRLTVDLSGQEKECGVIRFAEHILLSPGITYAIRISGSKSAKTYCGEGGVTQIRLINGARVFFSGCSMSQNGTTVQRGQIPFLLYSILEKPQSLQITERMIHENFVLLIRLLANKIGGALGDGCLPGCAYSLVSRISPHIMVFMERYPDKSLEVMSILEQIIPLISNINGTVKQSIHTSGRFEDSQESDLAESVCVNAVVESPHPYKPNSTFSMVVVFEEYVNFMCVRFSPMCETAQFDDQLTIYLGVDQHSYMPIERCYGSHDWPDYPMILPGNSLWFVLDTASQVDGASSEQMFGFHVTVTGYVNSPRDTNLRLEQELVWLSANGCRIITQLPINPRSLEHLSTAEDDTRHLFEKHGMLLKKGLNLSHSPTLSELINKGHPAAAQSADLQFLREFLVGNPSNAPGFLSNWLPTGSVVDPAKCQLAVTHEETKVGKPVTLKLSCRDQYDRQVNCPKLQVDVVATLGSRSGEATRGLPSEMLPSSLIIHQNPYQPIIANHTKYINMCAMPAFVNFSLEEIRLGYMRDQLVKDVITMKPLEPSIFSATWTPAVPGKYKIECKIDGYDISHSYTLQVDDRVKAIEEKSTRRVAQMSTAKTVVIPFSPDFSGIRMRLGATLASTCVGVIPRGAIIEYIEEIENDDGKWIRLTDETTMLYGCTLGNGQVWCLAYHRPLRRELIPLKGGTNRETTVRLRKKEFAKEGNQSKHQSVSIDATEMYTLASGESLNVYFSPNPAALISGEIISGPSDVMSSGWLTNRHGVWIKLAGCEKYVLQKTETPSDTSLSLSTNGNEDDDELMCSRVVEAKSAAAHKSRFATAMTPSVADCIRTVFAAFVWHEHLVKDLMAASAYLRFHQNLHNIWQSCDVPAPTNAPAALQPIVKIWREICEAVETSVEQHLIMPPVSTKAVLSESSKAGANQGGCELCDEVIKGPPTVHLRMAHPGCGGDCLGYGYNSNGKFTTGWSGQCGTGGRGQSPWYLMCNNCRSQYLRKTPAGHHQERTRRWREFRFSTTASDARPEVIIKQNALFLLDLNCRLQTESNNSSAATSGWTINLFPTHSSTPSTMPRSMKKFEGSIAKSSYMAQSLMKAGCSSDPGPKVALIVSPPGNNEDQSASLSRHPPITEPAEVLQSPSAALRTLFSTPNPSTSALLKRPVLAFCVEHHDLRRIRSACVQSVRRAVSFSHAFRVWNWLLRMVSSETSVSDVILQYLTSLTSYNRLAEYMYSNKKNTNILPHPWRLSFLAGPIAAEMVCQLHAFLHTVSIILQSSGVDGRLRSLCFKAWTLQLTAQEQDLLILTCNILATVGGVLSDTSINEVMKQDVEVQEMIDITKFAKITASSRQAMVICLTDESGETFWESGDEDKTRARSLTVQLEDDVKGVLLSLYIDNNRDENYRVTTISFRGVQCDGSRKELTSISLENNYSGWVKCCISSVKHVQIQLKGAGQSCRVRQLAIVGFTAKPQISSSIPPSTSHHLLFSNTQRDAFALFQAISSQAFCGELSEDDTLRERVIDLLFSRVQLYPLQNYVYNQVVEAMEREVDQLCGKSKRNYSYCCGLMGLLVRICDSRGSLEFFGQRNSILTSITQLLIFAPIVVQRQCLNSLECIIGSFSPASIEISRIIRNLLVVVGKVIQLQVRDKASHSVVTVHLCTSVLNAPQSWRIDKMTDMEIGRQCAQLITNICNEAYSKELADATKSELGNCLLSLVQMPESLSCSESISSIAKHKSTGIVSSKRFWVAIAALALIKDKTWLELSDRWRTIQEQVEEEPVTLCENHDDGHTVAQVFCVDCDVALCKECFTIMHLHKKNRNHMVKNLSQTATQHDINIHQGCARLKFMNFLVLFHGDALNGMIEIAADTIFPSTSSQSSNPMHNSALHLGHQNATCRFCGNSVPSNIQNLDGTCNHEDCVNYAKDACSNVHPCGHYCGGIKGETDCLSCMNCKRSEATQDGDDVCVICFTERLGAAPCVQLECGHVFHYHCVRMILERRWNGPRIVFRFMHCPLCIQKIVHPGLTDLIAPLLALRQEVIEKAKMRLEYDGLLTCAALTDPRSEFHNQPEEYALERYMYVLCYKCKKAYFGGESRCQAALDSSQYNPEELICGACSDTSGVQICSRHGAEYLEYKCRFCCSIAVYFCFGTTHFCAPCHDDFQRLITLPKKLLPPCPVGPRSMPLEEGACPLKIKHPPTGEEFAMGCGICRNISTF